MFIRNQANMSRLLKCSFQCLFTINKSKHELLTEVLNPLHVNFEPGKHEPFSSSLDPSYVHYEPGKHGPDTEVLNSLHVHYKQEQT